MKIIVFASALLLLALPLVAGDHTAHKSESGWFDMEGCVFCKNLTEDPGLLPHMTWETHKTSNGSMTVAMVEPAYRASYEKAGKAMEAIGTKMMNGEMNPMAASMCGHCKMFGQLMMAGASREQIHGQIVDVALITSDNAAVVAMIHQMVDRDNQEMQQMAPTKGDHDHHGHDHDHGHVHEH